MTSLRIATLTLVGYEIDGLDKILRQWLSDGFEVAGPNVELANDLRAKLSASPTGSSFTVEVKPSS